MLQRCNAYHTQHMIHASEHQSKLAVTWHNLGLNFQICLQYHFRYLNILRHPLYSPCFFIDDIEGGGRELGSRKLTGSLDKW